MEGCVPIRNMKLVSDLLANEKYHYVELNHGRKQGVKSCIGTTDKLWELDLKNAYVLHSLGLPRHQNKIYGEIDFVVVCDRGAACFRQMPCFTVIFV